MHACMYACMQDKGDSKEANKAVYSLQLKKGHLQD